MRRRQAIFAMLALAACAGDDDAAVDPVWGKQPCAHCAMLVSAPMYAAQLVGPDGARAFFDDIGCMAAYARERGIAARRLWVRDADTNRWIDARGARYSAGATTPMDFGFVARAGGEGVDFTTMEREVMKRLARGEGAS